jgi:hypothetical protein
VDGESLLYKVRQLLGESSGSAWLDDRTTYDYLYEAAKGFVARTDCLTFSQTITTVATSTDYTLNADFMQLYLTNDHNKLFVKYYDGAGYTFPPFREYGGIYYANQTSSKSIPDSFTISDSQTTPAQVTGTCTTAGALSNGEAILTDSAAAFTTYVSVGDAVHNTTDSAHGVVIAVNSASAINTAMFGGTDNDWDSLDAYIIVPQGRLKLVVDPPSSTSGHSIYVPYVQCPVPVYSSYRQYRIPTRSPEVLASYAAWKYKYRDREPNFGDALYKMYEAEIRLAGKKLNNARGNAGFRVNFTKQSSRDRSYR